MKMKKTLVSALFATTLLATSSVSMASTQDPFQRYSQAKINIAYEGEMGDLLQSLSHRLGVAYLSHNTDFTKHIKVVSKEPMTVEALLALVKQQAPQVEIKFDKVADTVILTVFNANSPLKLKNEQFIGDVIFVDETKSEGNAALKQEVKQEKMNNQLEVIPATSTVESATEAKQDAEAEKKTVNNAEENQDVVILPLDDAPEAKALNDLVARTTDQARIAKYKKKKSPKYKIIQNDPTGLASVKVTPLGTFLIFEPNVDVSMLKVLGQFEAVAQYGNVIAISHEKWVSPRKIEIINANKQKLTLEKALK